VERVNCYAISGGADFQPNGIHAGRTEPLPTAALVRPCLVRLPFVRPDGTGTGSYGASGLSGISSGAIVLGTNDFLGGFNVQEKLQDNNGSALFFTGGRSSRPLAGFGLDRSFQGQMIVGGTVKPLYAVNDALSEGHCVH
jgi:hypothetical protein